MRARRDGVAFGVAFGSQLLEPEDWFAFWRLNCVLASYHAQIAGGDGYEMEDKLAFLERLGLGAGVGVGAGTAGGGGFCHGVLAVGIGFLPWQVRVLNPATLTLTLTKVRGGGPAPIALAQVASQAHLQAPQRGQG